MLRIKTFFGGRGQNVDGLPRLGPGPVPVKPGQLLRTCDTAQHQAQSQEQPKAGDERRTLLHAQNSTRRIQKI
jgi:hypothetical protein